MKRRRRDLQAETEVMTRSGRRCCMCFALDGSLEVNKGQIAHLDRNPEHSTADNLAFLCIDHHDEYDTRPSQSKGWSIKEVKEYRRLLYRAIENLREVNAGDIPTAVDVAVLDIGHNLYAWDRGSLPRIKADYHLLACAAAENDYLLLERDLADFSSGTLGGVSLIVLVCPRDAHYTKVDIDHLVQFVGSGGLLLILSYYWWRCDHDANVGDLTAKFQITLRDDRIYDATEHDRNEYRPLCSWLPANMPRRPVVLPFSCSMTTEGSVEALLLTGNHATSEEATYVDRRIVRRFNSSQCGPLVVGARVQFRRGRVVVLGSWEAFLDEFASQKQFANGDLQKGVFSWLRNGPQTEF